MDCQIDEVLSRLIDIAGQLAVANDQVTRLHGARQAMQRERDEALRRAEKAEKRARELEEIPHQ